MKTILYLFLVAIFVIAGCAKDDPLSETPISFKAEGWLAPNLQSGSKYMIGGTATPMGKINSEQSYYDFQTIKCIKIDGFPFLDIRGIGKMKGVKGDSFEFTFTNRQSLINDRLVGKIDIIPGSGMGIFKDCSGSFKTVGEPDVSGIHLYVFTIEGELVFE